MKKKMIGEDTFRHRSKYVQAQVRLRKLFEEDYPDVPFGSIKLEIGKDYIGDADGYFEVRTINEELWFVFGCCCNFDEKIKK